MLIDKQEADYQIGTADNTMYNATSAGQSLPTPAPPADQYYGHFQGQESYLFSVTGEMGPDGGSLVELENTLPAYDSQTVLELDQQETPYLTMY